MDGLNGLGGRWNASGRRAQVEGFGDRPPSCVFVTTDGGSSFSVNVPSAAATTGSPQNSISNSGVVTRLSGRAASMLSRHGMVAVFQRPQATATSSNGHRGASLRQAKLLDGIRTRTEAGTPVR